ncbi:hypothetical protein QWZ13_18065 [Reinekea marina]|uniref:hypothetical protein n=1 Tax=Reinekea marina TaxID=1310421 RepID=UPI0025B3AC05|nr:hypothetical protein [Reinekea marina]MDN3650816.1 hypothetical protein [Reinekea marina]
MVQDSFNSFKCPSTCNAKFSGERERVHSPPHSGEFKAALLQRIVNLWLSQL